MRFMSLPSRTYRSGTSAYPSSANLFAGLLQSLVDLRSSSCWVHFEPVRRRSLRNILFFPIDRAWAEVATDGVAVLELNFALPAPVPDLPTFLGAEGLCVADDWTIAEWSTKSTWATYKVPIAHLPRLPEWLVTYFIAVHRLPPDFAAKGWIDG